MQSCDSKIKAGLITVKKCYQIHLSQFRIFWGSIDIYPQKENSKGKNSKQFEKLKNLILSSTVRHPKRPPIVDYLIDLAILNDDFDEFWKIFEANLSKLSYEKKFVALDALNYAIPKIQNLDHLVLLLSGECARVARNSLVDSNRFLHSKAEFVFNKMKV